MPSANVTALRAQATAASNALSTALTAAESTLATAPLYDAEGGALSTVNLKAHNARLRGALAVAIAYASAISADVTLFEAPTVVQIVVATGLMSGMQVGVPTISVASPPAATVNAAINCGGPAHTDGVTGTVWSADQYFVGGASYDDSSQTTLGVADPFVFATERGSVDATTGWQYAIPVPAAGNYVVSMLWAENYAPAAQIGNRPMDVFFGNRTTGTKIVNKLDTFYCAQAAYGQGLNRALVIERNVTTTGTTLNLDFAAAAGAVNWPGALHAIIVRTGADALSDPAALNNGGTTGTLPGTRTKSVWPFLQTSIWNTPIGSGAVYQAGPGWTPANGIHPDPVTVVQVSAGDPFVAYYTPANFNDRVTGATLTGTFQVPNAFTFPNASAQNTPNAHCAFIQPDGEAVIFMSGVARPVAGGPIYAYRYDTSTDSYLEHLSTGAGSHGTHASQLSALGGALRDIDFTGQAIYHALDLECYENLCYKNGGTRATSFVYPAIQADGYFASAYGVNNGALPAYCKIGMLLAIHPTKVYADYNVTTALGKRFFDCLQNFGGYATESSAWDAANIAIRADANAALNNAGGLASVSAELSRMIGGLYVVTNNAPGAIGGGGTPRQPLAPPFA